MTTPCQTLRGETVEVSSKQFVIKTPCQTGIGVLFEISKQAACYQDTLSNRHRSDCWNFQGSSAACSNVIWGRHRTPRHLAGKLVFKRMLHLCPFTIRTPATLNRSLTWKWKIELLESKSFPGSGSILGCLKKCEPFWERNVKPRNPCSSML